MWNSQVVNKELSILCHKLLLNDSFEFVFLERESHWHINDSAIHNQQESIPIKFRFFKWKVWFKKLLLLRSLETWLVNCKTFKTFARKIAFNLYKIMEDNYGEESNTMFFGSDRSPRCQDVVCVSICPSVIFSKFLP